MNTMRDTIVFDLETKHSFAEVGGERNVKGLGISVAGVYSYAKDAFFAFEEHELTQFESMLQVADHVIGFNVVQFDIPVMEPYLKQFSFDQVAVTDMFVDVVQFTGHRVGLNALAKATLMVEKSAHGLEALQWYKEGKMDEIKKYCLDDVKITRDLYEYGKAHGHVLFQSNVDGKTRSVPVSWGKKPVRPIRAVLEDALKKRERLAVEYISSQNDEELGFRKERLIDVYALRAHDIEAYCHLRKGVRNFRIDRITKALPNGEHYTLPQDVQTALF